MYIKDYKEYLKESFGSYEYYINKKDIISCIVDFYALTFFKPSNLTSLLSKDAKELKFELEYAQEKIVKYLKEFFIDFIYYIVSNEAIDEIYQSDFLHEEDENIEVINKFKNIDRVNSNIEDLLFIRNIFKNYNWSPKYGGESYIDICDKLIDLMNSSRLEDERRCIDFLIHIQHNTGNLFTKYYNYIEELRIDTTIKDKRFVFIDNVSNILNFKSILDYKNIFEFLKHSTSNCGILLKRILKIFGETEESNININDIPKVITKLQLKTLMKNFTLSEIFNTIEEYKGIINSNTLREIYKNSQGYNTISQEKIDIEIQKINFNNLKRCDEISIGFFNMMSTNNISLNNLFSCSKIELYFNNRYKTQINLSSLSICKELVLDDIDQQFLDLSRLKSCDKITLRKSSKSILKVNVDLSSLTNCRRIYIYDIEEEDIKLGNKNIEIKNDIF